MCAQEPGSPLWHQSPAKRHMGPISICQDSQPFPWALGLLWRHCLCPTGGGRDPVLWRRRELNHKGLQKMKIALRERVQRFNCQSGRRASHKDHPPSAAQHSTPCHAARPLLCSFPLSKTRHPGWQDPAGNSRLSLQPEPPERTCFVLCLSA